MPSTSPDVLIILVNRKISNESGSQAWGIRTFMRGEVTTDLHRDHHDRSRRTPAVSFLPESISHMLNL